MCGLVAIARTYANAPVPSGAISRMREAIAHRGPDARGEWFGDGIQLGHQRLSIVDVESPPQPWLRGSLSLVFNGEIYNYKTLKKELESVGEIFSTDCDTEVLAALFSRYGNKAFSMIDGMFSCIIYDDSNGNIVAARDRFGIKPLYIADDENGFRLFSSELAGIKAFSSRRWEHSNTGIEQFLTLGYLVEPETGYKGIRQLLPGTVETYRVGCSSVDTDTFWSINEAMQPGKEISVDDGQELLRSAVLRQSVADVPLGSFLSGGLDSGVITSILSESREGNVDAFSAGFNEAGFDEIPVARLAAQNMGIRHHERYFDHTLLERTRDMVDIYGGAFADNASIPTFEVSKLASKHVKVLLSGDGADELFFGYRNHRALFMESAIKSAMPSWFRTNVLRWVAEYYPNSPSMPRFLRAKSTLRALSMGLAEGYCSAMSVTSRDVLNKIYHKDFVSSLQGYTTEKRFAEIASLAENRDPMKVMQYLDFKTYLPGSVLTKVDRATMRAGVEARVPFLDNALSQAVLSQPSHLNLGFGQHKTQLRQWSSPWLPASSRARVKKSFTSPLDSWFRALQYPRFCRIIMSDSLIDSNIFDVDSLQRLMDEHYRGEANHGTTLWSIAVLSRALT